MPRFIHPAHSRGLRSPSLSFGQFTELTDKKIKAYTLAGRYGEEAKRKLEESLKKKGKKTQPSLKAFKHLL